jgi:serine/threonine protein kinase, bacterial
MSAPLQPGVIVNSRYRIVRTLGSGSFGAVYLGADLREKGSYWAVKEVLCGGIIVDRREFLETFRHEARMLSALSHAGIPRIVDYFITGGRGYLVMERIEGLTLEEIYQNNKKPLLEKEVLPWALQICTTLVYLHGHTPPIIYRDLKPSNVMLTLEGRVVLIDFGIARFYYPGRESDAEPMGTPGYSPPEQYKKDQTVPASDIYALGTTLYFLLTGADMAAYNFRFPPAPSLNPDISSSLGRVIERCLELKVADRYSTAAELKEMLLHCLEHGASGKGLIEKYGKWLRDLKFPRITRRTIPGDRSGSQVQP